MKSVKIFLLALALAILWDIPAKADLRGDMMVLTGNFDFSGTQNYYDNFGFFTSGYNTDTGYGLGVELYHSFWFNTTSGIGVRYEFQRAFSGTDWKYSFVPIYFTAMSSNFFYLQKDFVPFLKIEVGYDVLFMGNDAFRATSLGPATLNGGFYLGFGGGVKLMDWLFIELMYNSYSGTFTASDATSFIDQKVIDSRITLNIGVAFQLYDPPPESPDNRY